MSYDYFYAVYKFKRYEDASLSYTGINRHDGEDRGGWDTVLSDADYNKMFTLQQASMEAPAPAPDDLPAKPYFTPDEDEPKPAPAKKPAPQPAKPIISYGGFTPKTNTAQNTQASGSKIHKPSNSYTPRPVSGTPRQLYTPPGEFEWQHWSCKAELWSEQPASRSAKTACQGGCFQNQGWCQGQA